VFARPGFMEKVRAIDAPPMQMPGPDRETLLRLLA